MNTQQNRTFLGPVFLVGAVRSGTKLLRDLLNRNPAIGIPVAESHFIPYMVEQFGNPPQFDSPERLDEFYQTFVETNWYWGYQEKYNLVLPRSAFDQLTDTAHWAPIFEFILRYYAPAGRSDPFIWGDKTPQYVSQMQLLKEIFPAARFIHLIRDPRDYCLSVRQSWGKSIYRAAHEWHRVIANADHAQESLGADYLEITYESLLDEPERTLRRICQFLHCDFNPAMLELDRATEPRGSARGQTQIVRTNYGKFRTQMKPREIKRIEEIVYPQATRAGYTMELADSHKPLSKAELYIHTLYDIVASVKLHVRDKGLRDGLQYIFRYHSQTGLLSAAMKSVRRRVRPVRNSTPSTD